jgi:dihydrodipicolinate reductase
LAVGRGVACVVGSSGLTEADYAAIDLLAREQGVGIIAAGNFSVMAAILQHCALLAARHLASFEVIDYASADKADVPSGTSRELAERLSGVRTPSHSIAPQAVAGAGLEMRPSACSQQSLATAAAGFGPVDGRLSTCAVHQMLNRLSADANRRRPVGVA